MLRIHTKVEFEAAHRQLGDPDKCGKLHGHSWVVEVDAIGRVDDIGYIVNFSKIKDIITRDMDHSTILMKGDPLVDILKDFNQKVFVVKKNPTCENLAEFIIGELNFNCSNVQFTVKVWESPKSYAEAS
ncbi:MAG: 6-carboxytetrahydropterin synthase [Candidatus Omnitrophota bacterium]